MCLKENVYKGEFIIVSKITETSSDSFLESSINLKTFRNLEQPFHCYDLLSIIYEMKVA